MEPSSYRAVDYWNRGTRRVYAIGASQYEQPVVPLSTPRRDADSIAELLENRHGYVARRLTSGQVGLEEIVTLLEEMQAEVAPDDRVIFYFAGHGVAPDIDSSRSGYLLPETAARDDQNTFLSMDKLYEHLSKLQCRHLLVVLDCCFAGSFRWARMRSDRDFSSVPEAQIYFERFRRFLSRRAWQLLTSAGATELAADILFGQREEKESCHSPFASALLDGLTGAADYRAKNGEITRDGVITLRKLVDFLSERMLQLSDRQMVGYYPLEQHDDGEFLFLTPGTTAETLSLPAIGPKLRKQTPYLGLKTYEFSGESARPLYGRDEARRTLFSFVGARAFTVVTGASGTGKSSLVRAGLMRDLAACPEWRIIPPFRPGMTPLANLAGTIRSVKFPLLSVSSELITDHVKFSEGIQASLRELGAGQKLLVCIDQLEDLLTQSVSEEEIETFCKLIEQLTAIPGVHVIVTIRSDYERRFTTNPGANHKRLPLSGGWASARFPIPAMSEDEFRDVIRGPANERAVRVEQAVVDLLVREASGRPGRLPLLSATLETLYQVSIDRLLSSDSQDWNITLDDYQIVGGVEDGVIRRLDQFYSDVKLDGDLTSTLGRITLRLVSQEGLTLAKRQVSKLEFICTEETAEGQAENKNVQKILKGLTDAWILVSDTKFEDIDSQDGVFEFIHDVVVQEWKQLQDWAVQSKQGLALPERRRLTQDAAKWEGAPSERQDQLTWANNIYLSAAAKELTSDPFSFNALETNFIKESRRRRTISSRRTGTRAFIVAALVVLLVAGIITALQQTRLRGQEGESRRLASQAELIRVTQPDLAALLSAQALKVKPTNEARASLLRTAAEEPRLLRFLTGQDDNVEQLSFSPDGKLLVAANSTSRSGSGSGRLTVWDVDTGKRSNTYPYQFLQVMGLGVSPDSRHVATSFAGGTIRLTDLMTGKHEDWKPFGDGIDFDNSISFTRDGKYLLSNEHDAVWKLDISDRADSIHKLKGHTASRADNEWHAHQVSTVLLLDDGKTVYTGGYDGRVIRHDLSTDTGTELSVTGQSAVTALAFDRESKLLAIGRKNGEIDLHGLNINTAVFHSNNNSVKKILIASGGKMFAAEIDGRLLICRVGSTENSTFIDYPGLIFDFSFDISNQYLAVSGRDSELRIYSTADGKQQGESMQGHGWQIYRASFSPKNPGILATAGDDGTVILWNVSSTSRLAKSVTTGDALSAGVGAVALSPLDDAIALGGEDGTLSIRKQPGSDPKLWKSPDPHQMFRHFRFSSDGRLLVAGGEASELAVLDLDSDQKVRFISLPSDSNVQEIYLSADGKTAKIVDAGGMQAVRLSDGMILSEKVSLVPQASDKGILLAAAFRPDGEQVALGYENGEIWLNNINSTTPRLFDTFQKGITALAYTPDGKAIAAAGTNTVRLTEVETRNPPTTLLDGYRATVTALTISPSGQLLAAGGLDGAILLFDLDGRQLLGTLPAHKDTVFSLAFHPKADRLLSGGKDKRAIIWNLDFADLREKAAAIVGRNFSAAEWKSYMKPDAPYERTFENFDDGENVSAAMKENAPAFGRWIIMICFLAWGTLAINVRWENMRSAPDNKAPLAIHSTIAISILIGALAPRELLYGISNYWIDMGMRIFFLVTLTGFAIWAQRFLGLRPAWPPDRVS